MNLPKEPGLKRRLAYGKYITNLLYKNKEEKVSLLFSPFEIGNPPNSPLPIPLFSPTDNYFSYEELIEFENVRTNIISKTLHELSNVHNNYDITEHKLCVICQEYIYYNNIVRSLYCTHVFHINCIDKWFSENTKCPICKYCYQDAQ